MAVLVRDFGAVLMSDLLRQTCQAVQAFDESSTFMGGVKTLESFEGLLERPAVTVMVRKCGAVLMSDLTLDLRRVSACPDFLCVMRALYEQFCDHSLGLSQCCGCCHAQCGAVLM